MKFISELLFVLQTRVCECESLGGGGLNLEGWLGGVRWVAYFA